MRVNHYICDFCLMPMGDDLTATKDLFCLVFKNGKRVVAHHPSSVESGPHICRDCVDAIYNSDSHHLQPDMG